jgi:hypothetical protein
LELFELCRGCQAHANLPLVHSSRSTLNQGPFPPRSLPASKVLWAPPTPVRATPFRHVRSAPRSHRPPVLRTPPCTHAAPIIPVGHQAWSIASTWHFGLPRFWDGSAPTSVLSGPAQASLALRPAHSLDLLSGAFFFGASAQAVAHLHRPMASEVHRQFLGRDFHPLVNVHPHGAPKKGPNRRR